MNVVFSEHAAWRTAERGSGHVHIDVLAEQIGLALLAGWYERGRGGLRVTLPDGRRFVVYWLDDCAVVMTALKREERR